MKNIYKPLILKLVLFTAFFAAFKNSEAQTDMDALMMAKHNFCTGIMYSNNSWKNYWEGNFKRDNQNLGTVGTAMIGFMGNYGIKDNLNLIFSLPYIRTKASQGQLVGQHGLQDLSLTLKWMPIDKKMGKGDFSVYTLAALSTPVNDYVADFLPLSIGMGSSTGLIRVMADYQLKNFFVTGSAAFMMRNKVTIDRTAYYTTQMHYTNEVEMPNMANFNLRSGFRSSKGYAEAILDIFQTNGGFDITKNNMPFLSNQMNGSRVGIGFKYNIGKLEGLSVVGNSMFTLAGRNIGQTTSMSAGVFYVLDFTKKNKSAEPKIN